MEQKHHGPRGSFACLAALLAAFFVMVWVSSGSPHRDLKPENVLPTAQAANGDTNVPAQVSDSGYAPDTNYTTFRSAISVVDTKTLANMLALPAFQVSGRTTFMLKVKFTDAAATVSLQLAYVWRHPYAASDTDTSSRDFNGKTLSFQPQGAGKFTPVWTQAAAVSVASNQVTGYSPIYTLTAGSTQYEGAYYVPTAGDLQLDTERAITIRLLVTTAVSAGSITVRAGS